MGQGSVSDAPRTVLLYTKNVHQNLWIGQCFRRLSTRMRFHSCFSRKWLHARFLSEGVSSFAKSTYVCDCGSDFFKNMELRTSGLTKVRISDSSSITDVNHIKVNARTQICHGENNVYDSGAHSNALLFRTHIPMRFADGFLISVSLSVYITTRCRAFAVKTNINHSEYVFEIVRV